MISFPNAKINLGLHIIEKRKDGFHNLESCFYPVPWHDILEIMPDEKLSFSSTGLEIPGKPEENLCLKAYQLLARDFNIGPVAIHLHKILPIGAGLGGGSSDAAFALKSLNQVFELSLDDDRLCQYARQLGSDCAFFIKNVATLAKEKGDQFENINVNLTGKHLVLIFPNIHVSTSDAYGGITPATPAKMIAEIIENEPLKNWKASLANDFEYTVFAKYPVLEQIKSQLYETGAVYASMSGSGSALFGLFEAPPALPAAFDGYQVWQGKLP